MKCLYNVGVLGVVLLALFSGVCRADILVATGSKIERYDVKGNSLGTFIQQATTGMYYEPKGEKLYFTGYENSIHRVDRDGQNNVTIWSGLDEPPLDLVVDTTNSKIIWTSSNDATIYRANLDGTGSPEILVASVSEAWGLAIDEINGYIYYTSFGRIYRVDLDGSNQTYILTDGDGNSFLTFLIKVGNTLYWSNPTEGSIKSFDLESDDTDGTTIMSNSEQTELQGLSFNSQNNLLYFLEDSGGEGIRSMRPDGSKNNSVNSTATGLDIIADYSTGDLEDTFKDLPDFGGRIYMGLSGGGTEVGAKSSIFWTRLATSFKRTEIFSSNTITSIQYLAYSQKRKRLYFIGGIGDSYAIYSLGPEGEDFKKIYDDTSNHPDFYPFGMFFDNERDKLLVSGVSFFLFDNVPTVAEFDPDTGARGDILFYGGQQMRPGVFALPGYRWIFTSEQSLLIPKSGTIYDVNTLLNLPESSWSMGFLKGKSGSGIFYNVSFSGCVKYITPTGNVVEPDVYSLFCDESQSLFDDIAVHPINFHDNQDPYVGFYSVNSKVKIFDPTKEGGESVFQIMSFDPGIGVTSILSTPYTAALVTDDDVLVKPAGAKITTKVTAPGKDASSTSISAAGTYQDIPVYLVASSDTIEGAGTSLAAKMEFTDENGDVGFSDIPDGTYSVTFKKENLIFFPKSYDISTDDDPITTLAEPKDLNHVGCKVKSVVGKLKKVNAKTRTLLANLMSKADVTKDLIALKAVNATFASMIEASSNLPSVVVQCKASAKKECTKSKLKKKVKTYVKSLKNVQKKAYTLASRVATNENAKSSLDSKIDKLTALTTKVLSKYPSETYSCSAAE